MEELHGSETGAGLQGASGETSHEGTREGGAIDGLVFLVASGVGNKGMAERTDIGFQFASSTGAKGTERDVAVVLEVGIDTTHTEYAVGIGGGDDGFPGCSGGLVASGVADQYAFAGSHVAGFGHIGGAVHLPNIITLLAVSEGAADNLGTVLVSPFHGLCPPYFLFERLQFHLGAGKEELCTSGKTYLSGISDAGDAAEGHGAVAVPTIDIFLIVAEIPGLDDLVVVEQVLERLMGIDFGETAIEDGNADTLAVDALLGKFETTHADELVVEGQLGFRRF